MHSELKTVQRSLLAAQTFWSNFYFWSSGGYFGPVNLKPLLHIWSLSVEEQFYIIFPGFLFLFFKIKNDQILFTIIAIIVATLSSFVLWVYLNNIGGQRPAFLLLPTRVWQFGLGSLVAFIHFEGLLHKQYSSALPLFIGTGIIFLGLIFPISTVANAIVVSIGSTFFIFSNPNPRNFLVSFFSQKILVSIGKISFSVYLYHAPIAIFLIYYSVETPPVLYSFLGVILTYFLGFISYSVIERPFRYKYSGYRTFILVFVTALLSHIVLFSTILLKEETWASQLSKAVGTNYRCSASAFTLLDGQRACVIGSKTQDLKKILLIGNSHAQMYAPLVGNLLTKENLDGLLLPVNDCLPTTKVNISEYCIQKAKRVFDTIIRNNSFEKLILVTTWHRNKFVDEQGNKVTQKDWLEDLSDLIRKFQTQNIKVALFSPIMVPETQISSFLPRLIKFDRVSPQEILDSLRVERDIYNSRYERINITFKGMLKNSFIEVYKDLCDLDYCYFGEGDELFFSDAFHLTENSLKRLIHTDRSLESFIRSD